MSIRNQRTGRHEDDLFGEASANDGQVSLESLLAHLREIVGDPASGYGDTVHRPVMVAWRLLQDVEARRPEMLPRHVPL